MKVMIFDTETDGLPRWDRPSEHPDQPHLVQFTGVICDGAPERELAFEHFLVKPDGWSIPPELTALHHITNQQAHDEGISVVDAIDRYVAMVGKADLVAAFGISFDTRIMRIQMLRNGYNKQVCDDLRRDMKTHCVMTQATPLCRLPPTDRMLATGRKTWKTPTLTEAVKAIFGETLEGAHDSRIDVLATARLYYAINKTLL